MLPEKLQSDRLTFKRPSLDLAQQIFETYATDPAVTKYMSWTPHTDVQQTIVFLESLSNNWDEHREYAWSLFRKSDDQLIGMITLRIDSFQANGGYLLAKPYWGNGYMAEALIEVRDLAFSLPEIQRFQLVCDVENPASARVMEKAGFEKEGVLRKYILHPNISDVPRNCLCYSYIR